VRASVAHRARRFALQGLESDTEYFDRVLAETGTDLRVFPA
jgi:uncharacterized protein involved in type VI secretion and phage assembly